ncbi:MAG: hypothetical protein AAFR09_10730 [Pseudomonadota bacterium]
MNRRSLALILLVPMTVVTGVALIEVGLVGILEQFVAGPGAWQIGLDLVTALVLVLSWLFQDARANGRNPWPWLVLTLCAGSFGPLLYLATSRSHRRVTAVASGA